MNSSSGYERLIYKISGHMLIGIFRLHIHVLRISRHFLNLESIANSEETPPSVAFHLDFPPFEKVFTTVLPGKSESDVVFYLQLLSKILTCTLQLSLCESIDHSWIGLIPK